MSGTTLMMKHEFKPEDVLENFNDNPVKWFEEKAQAYDLKWLLVHADDGVIWGKMQNGQLQLASSIYVPKLRAITIQTAYLFGESGELLLWKTGNMRWKSRILKEGLGTEVECYDEERLLWGDTIEKDEQGFMLLCQGSEGLRHALPLETENKNICHPKIKVRHFLDYDDDGQAYIKFSRLVSLVSKTDKEAL